MALPPIKDIVKYWSPRVSEEDMGTDWDEAHMRCWRCGGKKKDIERCHIVPAALGGNDTVDNLVLLCSRCHKNAPNVKDDRYMWEWLSKTHAVFYDAPNIGNALSTYRTLYQSEPFIHCDPQMSTDKILSVFEDVKREMVQHWGEGEINTASLVWAMREVERRLIA